MYACMLASLYACKHTCRQVGRHHFFGLGQGFILGGREGHMLVRLDLVVGRHTEGMGLF